jgi:membrane protein
MRHQRLLRDLGIAALAGLGGAILVSRLSNTQVSARDSEYEQKTAQRSQQGARAVSPTDLPVGGWVDILRRTYHEVDRDRVLAVAAGVTFYALLALFPALTAVVSIYGLVAEPSTVGEQIGLVDGFLPAGSSDFLRDQVTRITEAGDTKLGFAFAFGLAVAIWSANAGVKAIFDALNVAYGEDEKRSFVSLNLVSLGFTVAILLFVLLAVGAIAALPVLLDRLYLGSGAELLISLARWPVLILVLILGLSALYRFGPSRDAAQWSWVSPGAVFASVGWLAASLLFSWYVANFEDYNKTYGAIGAVIGLLTWMWLSATIVLVGAEINSECERQTDRDTTKGPPMPIGMRGADAADRKG